MGEHPLGRAVILVRFVCYSRFGTAFPVLAIPFSLSFKPGHLSIASSTLMLAGAAARVLLLAGSLQSTFWVLVLAPRRLPELSQP